MGDNREMKRICIFCGSSFGKNEIYRSAVRQMGRVLAVRSLELIYGGGNVGLMGELARTMLAEGGRVTGVIPKVLYEKVEHVELSRLYIVQDMHQRKARMNELADAFIAMPGGIGTLEEFFEAFTWQQLGFHRKPVGLHNIGGFFDHLLGFLDHTVAEGFLKPVHRSNLQISSDPGELIMKLETFSPGNEEKWSQSE